MIFLMNVGSTVTYFGAAVSENDIRYCSMQTVDTMTDLEFVLKFRAFLQESELKPADFDRSVLSCVVPLLKEVLIRAMVRMFGHEPLLVDASCAVNFSIGLRKKEELGANLIALTAAIVQEYGVPAILLNIGTATSFGVIDGQAVYTGGVLYPGMQNALDALIGRTSLPPIKIDAVYALSGKNTLDSIGAGVLYGHAGAVDRILDELLEIVPGARIVVSGKRGKILSSVLCHETVYDPVLPLKGLYVIARLKEEKA